MVTCHRVLINMFLNESCTLLASFHTSLNHSGESPRWIDFSCWCSCARWVTTIEVIGSSHSLNLRLVWNVLVLIDSSMGSLSLHLLIWWHFPRSVNLWVFFMYCCGNSAMLASGNAETKAVSDWLLLGVYVLLIGNTCRAKYGVHIIFVLLNVSTWLVKVLARLNTCNVSKTFLLRYSWFTFGYDNWDYLLVGWILWSWIF